MSKKEISNNEQEKDFQELNIQQQENLDKKLRQIKMKEKNLDKREEELDNKEGKLLIDIEEYKKNLKKLDLKKMLIDKQKESYEENEKELLEKLEEIKVKEKDLISYKEKLANELELKFQDNINKLKDEILTLKENSNEIEQLNYEKEILKRDLKNKDKLIETLNLNLNSALDELDELKACKDLLESNGSIIELNKKYKLLKKENKSLNKKIEDYLSIKFDIEKSESERENLRNEVEILSHKLRESSRFIEYLKRLQQAKGIGEDVSNGEFIEIIKFEKEKLSKEKTIKYMGDFKAVEEFYEFTKRHNFNYDKKIIRNFIAAIKSSKFTILKGYSGTGKTSLPELFAIFLNAECVTIPVQPNWRTKQDIIGFYNYFNNKFIPTEFTKVLLRANVNKNKIFFIVLDEMNLARIEYYFSEINSKLWLGEDKKYIELFDQKIEYDNEILNFIKENKMKIPSNVFFIGTINEDDSVSPISDKIYDRAQVIEFSQFPDLRYMGNLDEARLEINSNKIINFRTFNNYAKENTIIEGMNIIQEVNKYIKEKFNKVIGYRSLTQIYTFINIYKEAGGQEVDAIDFQLISKLMQKIKFAYTNTYVADLQELKKVIKASFERTYNFNGTINLEIIKEIDNLLGEVE